MAAATVTGVYAAAVLELARERNALDAVLSACSELARGLTQEALVKLDDPRIGKTRAKGILLQVAEGAPEIILNTLTLLVDRNRLREAPAIFAEVIAQADAESGRVRVDVTLAFDASASLRKDIAYRMRKTQGEHAQIVERVDPSIVGGFTARIGDRYLDASVRRRLDGLIQAMHQAPISKSLWTNA
jgi:F-type H+-transporting ATPase subunit delta